MATDRSFRERNAASRERLAALVERLTAADLELATAEAGWTVGQSLVHLAFWDRFVETRWRAGLAAGQAGPTVYPDGLADVLNEALGPSMAAFAEAAGLGTATFALAAADSVDGYLAGLPDATVAAVLAERPALLDRSIHRLAHLAEIERALDARSQPWPSGSPSVGPGGRDFEAANATSRERLRTLAGSLERADLGVDLGGGWTVASAFAHLAFWDRFQAARWRAAREAGALAPVAYPEHPLDAFVNAGLDAVLAAVSPAAASRAALDAAAELDGLLAALPDAAVAAARALGLGYTLDRSGHRLDHVRQIERGLGRG